MNRIIIALILLVVLAAGAAGLYWAWLPRDQGLALAGVVESQEIRLGSKVGGRVDAVDVVEGQRVKAGDVLVRFAIPERLALLEQAKAKVAAAQANLDKLQAGSRREEIASAQAALQAAQARLQRLEKGWRDEEINAAKGELNAAESDVKMAQDEMDRIRGLMRAGGNAVSQKDYELARADLGRAEGRHRSAKARYEMFARGARIEDVAEAKAEVTRAEANYLLLYNGSRKEDIAAAAAALGEAKAKLAEIQADCDEAIVTAPGNAIVEVVGVRKGDLVSPNQPIIRVLKTDDVWVKVFVPETQLGKIHKNQPAQVTIDSHPGKTFQGKVSHIASIAEFLPRNVQSPDERRNQVFFVKVVITDAGAEAVFKPGMSASVVLPLQE